MKIIDLVNKPLDDDLLIIGFLGQSGYILKKENFTILIDPYLSNYIEHANGLNNQKMKRKFPPVINPNELDSVDAVLCTHSHFDHMDPWTLEKIHSSFKLYCSETAFQNNPVDLNLKQVVFLKWGETIELNKFYITPFPAAHYHKADHNGNPDCLSFLVKIDEITLFFWGDGILYDGLLDELIKFKYNMFFAPINGRDWFREDQGIIGNLNSRELAEICSRLNIEIVSPNHFDMFEYNGELSGNFINYLNQFAPNQTTQILNQGEIIKL